ncbi:UNKNOWN [Stylonychia lemnae]|uniref:Uncharacterized protein n=1 Tax=Stylonychia lemnae TaxID=5949 RepID=A0A078AYQ0_STYLE|nr:UNKNOWN [Stylonychia lemnae]|eukprot:CDW87294.1 UNKNOWN [Stylonychia lemnae]
MTANVELSYQAVPIREILYMSKEEKQIFATRLQTELQDFRQREQMYIEKRKELQDLELKYRKKADAMMGLNKKYQEKFDLNDEIIANLKEQIEQCQRQANDGDDENNDMQGKINAQLESIRNKENEIRQLKGKIQTKANEAGDIRRFLDKLVTDQNNLLEEKQNEEKAIQKLKEIRDMRKAEQDEYASKLRKLKNDQFRQNEKSESINRAMEAQQNNRQGLEQELIRMQVKLQQSQEQFNDLSNEKQKLDNVLRCHNNDIHQLTNQKKLFEENNRRMATGVSDIKKKVADLDSQIKMMQVDIQNLMQGNQYKEEENQQLANDLKTLEQHLNLLEQQNKELESELENFVQQDEMVKSKLVDRSRSKSPIKPSNINSSYYQQVPVKQNEYAFENQKGKDLGSDSFYNNPYRNNLINSSATTKVGTAHKGDYQTPFDASKRNYDPTSDNKSFFDSMQSSLGFNQNKISHHPLRLGNQSEFQLLNQSRQFEKENDNKYIPIRDKSRSPSTEQQYRRNNVKFADEFPQTKIYSNYKESSQKQAPESSHYLNSQPSAAPGRTYNLNSSSSHQPSLQSQSKLGQVSTLQPRIREENNNTASKQSQLHSSQSSNKDLPINKSSNLQPYQLQQQQPFSFAGSQNSNNYKVNSYTQSQGSQNNVYSQQSFQNSNKFEDDEIPQRDENVQRTQGGRKWPLGLSKKFMQSQKKSKLDDGSKNHPFLTNQSPPNKWQLEKRQKETQNQYQEIQNNLFYKSHRQKFHRGSVDNRETESDLKSEVDSSLLWDFKESFKNINHQVKRDESYGEFGSQIQKYIIQSFNELNPVQGKLSYRELSMPSNKNLHKNIVKDPNTQIELPEILKRLDTPLFNIKRKNLKSMRQSLEKKEDRPLYKLLKKSEKRPPRVLNKSSETNFGSFKYDSNRQSELDLNKPMSRENDNTMSRIKFIQDKSGVALGDSLGYFKPKFVQDAECQPPFTIALSPRLLKIIDQSDSLNAQRGKQMKINYRIH